MYDDDDLVFTGCQIGLSDAPFEKVKRNEHDEGNDFFENKFF